MFFFVFKQQWSCAKINLEVRPTERGGLIPEVNPYHQNKGFQIVRMESNGYNLRFMSCHIIYSLYHQSCSLLPAAIDRESNPCCFLVSSTGKNCTSVFHGFLRVWRSLWLYCKENELNIIYIEYFVSIGYSYCIHKGKFVYSKARVLFFYDALPKPGTEEKCQILKLE